MKTNSCIKLPSDAEKNASEIIRKIFADIEKYGYSRQKPLTRHKMDMVYDGDAFIFTDGKAKYVIHPNYAIRIDRKREKRVVFITATQIG